MDILQQLYDTVLERKDEKQEGSYTCFLALVIIRKNASGQIVHLRVMLTE